MIDSVIFDFWHTLVTFKDEERPKLLNKRVDGFQNVFNRHGYDLTKDEITDVIEDVANRCKNIRATEEREIPVSEMMRMVLKKANIEEDGEILNELSQVYSDAVFSIKLVLIDNVGEVLSHLKVDGMKLGIVSNTEHGTIEEKMLKSWHLYNYFDALVFSCRVGVRKPSPAIFHKVLASLKSKPENAIHVGDMPDIDVLGAKRAGIYAVYFKNGDKPYPSKLPKPDAVIEDLREIFDILYQK
ncbi:MAG TPA: HAD family hydrolase [bacterium (Candidatus Stahlbacteria)]|nr:HAD family hydrolase [Candidatus Stahlbacteria bacterium]